MDISFLRLTVLFVLGKCYKLFDDGQRNILLNLHTVLQEVNCNVEAGKWGKVDELSNTD